MPMVITKYFSIETNGFTDIHDVTVEVARILEQSPTQSGTVTVFVPGSTAGVTTIEYESGAIADFKECLERMAPTDVPYHHDARWGDGNGFSHVRAALLGASLTVPFSERRLLLGTWQQIILVDFDNRSRTRTIVVQVIGE